MGTQQQDIFGNSLTKVESVEFLVHTLKHHKLKLYKKCSNRTCSNEITNKPYRHYCTDHIIDEAIETDILIPFIHSFKHFNISM